MDRGTRPGEKELRITNYLPAQAGESRITNPDYIFEPSPKELIGGLVEHLMKMQIYDLILEANASEHSARMVAMKTASDNAKELSGKLNLEYNKARQAGITKELIEITSAVNTLS